MNRIFMRVKQLFAVLVLSLAGVFGMASLSAAQDGANDPYQQIELVTVELLETIATYQAGYPENEKAYFESLDALLLDRIDFAFIARNVMGSYNKVSTAEQRNTSNAPCVRKVGRSTSDKPP